MIADSFVSKSLWVREIHPSLRVFVGVLYSLLVVFFSKMSTIILSVIISVIIVTIAKLSFTSIMKRLLPLSFFLIMLWFFLPLSCRVGETVSISYIKSDVLLAMEITLKSVSISLIFMSLVATMGLSSLGYGLSCLCVPEKMICLFLITCRYIFLVEQEYRRITRAIVIRNFCPQTNIHTYRTYSYLVGMLVVRSYDRAKRVHNAMVCRNFGGSFLTVKEFSINKQSVIFVLCLGLLMALLFFYEIR